MPIFLVAIMRPWYEDKKVKVVQFYFETKSVTVTQRKLRKSFKATKGTSLNVSFQNVNRSLAQGTVRNYFKHHSGCKRIQRTSATVARVRGALQRRLRKSMRRLGQEDRCSRATAHWMARVDTEFLQLKHSLFLLKCQLFRQGDIPAHTAQETRD